MTDIEDIRQREARFRELSDGSINAGLTSRDAAAAYDREHGSAIEEAIHNLACDVGPLLRAYATLQRQIVEQAEQIAQLAEDCGRERMITLADNVLLKQKDAQIDRLTADLAECYRLSGADPDGNEDWRLALRAVEEVRRLRADYDADLGTNT